ncbi:MAG: CopD family protein [Bradyrhizobiaceae bacterium]|nr:CopD family protein [Bradyrhizobiaceae bacterium]
MGVILLLHVLGATIWTGGHIVLAVSVLPSVLRNKSPELLLQFERRYERIGMPALLAQVVTGLIMANAMLGDTGTWFGFSDPISTLVSIKLILLMLTVGLAIDARLRVLPHLSENNLVDLAWHVIPVTLLSIAFVVVGVSYRTGWFY